jgi:16S rRNA (guanine527-N7)-methyltransferase
VTFPDLTPMTPGEFAAAAAASKRVMDDLVLLRRAITDWNRRANLVGPSFETDYWRRHALDSAQLFHVEQRALRWADVGAGAGFPGVVLAILLKGRPGAQVHLVESLGKRVSFLEAICGQLELPVTLHHTRAERLHPTPEVDFVTARACAPLTRLLTYTKGFFDRGARGLFLKGQTAEQEVVEARRSWSFTSELSPSLSSPSGRLVRIDELSLRG